MGRQSRAQSSYDPQEIEPRWQKVWEEAGLYHTDLDGASRPFYNLMEFPYPSGEGLHVGHFYSYGGADTFGRFQRMRGYDVFQPMGFDAFGIHAENYALKLGINPAKVIPQNVHRFREEQLKRTGAAFDWQREVNTTDPRYYAWTQWIFLQLYKGHLAYRARARVNWCPHCLTTLADEQVIGGHCERCESEVEQKELTQWFLRITAYAERLLDFAADFTETTKTLQRHWIGRKEGAQIEFPLHGRAERIAVFSTRPETLYGATFLVLAPEHALAAAIATAPERPAVEAYIAASQRRSAAEREAGTPEKTGVWTGAWALHPLTGQRLPVWVADYVLGGMGTGAIFATPAHDQRDFDFAQAHSLPLIEVVRPFDRPSEETNGMSCAVELEAAWEGDGRLVHSGPYDGLAVAEARAAIIRDLEARGIGKAALTYRLRDWLISRQRYWGPPIPIVYCARCGEVPVPESELPVRLPDVEQFRPLGTGESPLAAVPAFVHTTCPRCGGEARRETDVSDNFLDSAWYYLRYTSTECEDRPWDNERLRKWLPVHLYIGGIEHSTLHHLYARFLWKAMQDLGPIPADLGPEPFARLRLHGLIIKDGKRMSKSRGNIVNPDEYVARYGADTLRIYLLFTGPFEEGGDFHDTDINGVVRFLGRVWRLAEGGATASLERQHPAGSDQDVSASSERQHPAGSDRDSSGVLQRAMHQATRDVTQHLERLGFNTAIATLMRYVNILQDWQGHAPLVMWTEAVRRLLLLIAPFAPHLAEELWARQGLPFSVHQQPWPAWDEQLAAEEMITLIVQVDGRLRDRIEAPATIGKEEAQQQALASARVQKHLAQRPVREVVWVPGKLLNLLTG